MPSPLLSTGLRVMLNGQATTYDEARRPRFDLSGIEMPARCCSDTFKRFERQNPDYSLTIFECPTKSKGREDLQPAYVGDESRANQITLILLYELREGWHGVHRAPLHVHHRKQYTGSSTRRCT